MREALRVAILAADPQRLQALQAIVGEAGCAAAALEDCDVVLADGAAAPEGGSPVVALGAAESGQAGLLPSAASPAQIAAALRAAALGLSVRGAAPVRPGFRALDGAGPLLTPREAEILALIGEGLSNKAVARRLGISGHTVKFHVEGLFRKLGAGSRAAAVHEGLRQGLIEL
jgi:two-component system nitrate/nitrite response regulator NarL